MANLHPELWAQGCAMCRAALESSAEGRVLAASLAHGIEFMLLLPYGLLGIFGFVIWRAFRKRAKAQEQDCVQNTIQN